MIEALAMYFLKGTTQGDAGEVRSKAYTLRGTLFKREHAKTHAPFTKRNDLENTFAGDLPRALKEKSPLCTSPTFRRTAELKGHLRAISGIPDTPVVTRRSKLSWTAQKELKLPKKTQAKRDERLRLTDYSYKDLI